MDKGNHKKNHCRVSYIDRNPTVRFQQQDDREDYMNTAKPFKEATSTASNEIRKVQLTGVLGDKSQSKEQESF